jgi:hypothetical protein
VPATVPRARPVSDPEPAQQASRAGRHLVLAGLGLVAVVLFGGALWRAVAGANSRVNARAAAAATAMRDRVRIVRLLRRLVSP